MSKRWGFEEGEEEEDKKSWDEEDGDFTAGLSEGGER